VVCGLHQEVRAGACMMLSVALNGRRFIFVDDRISDD
jgi:hypothetical protein